jgi:small GTP-binding protein
MARKKMKIVMLGEGRVGKTSLLHRFIHNKFDEECASTTKANMYANTKIEVDDILADVSIWDTAGQERYHALGPIYYRDAHGAVLAYDITDLESFERIKVWLKELHQVVGESICVVVVGNKTDLERERKVNKKDAEDWAAQNNAKHFLCSAKLGLRVSDAFHSLVQSIVRSDSTPSECNRNRFGSAEGSSRTTTTGTRSKGVKIAPTDEVPSRKTPGDSCAC